MVEQSLDKREVIGSNPIRKIVCIAQLVEQPPFKRLVMGSSPIAHIIIYVDGAMVAYLVWDQGVMGSSPILQNRVHMLMVNCWAHYPVMSGSIPTAPICIFCIPGHFKMY